MSDYKRDEIAEIVQQYVLIQRSSEWLNCRIDEKIKEISVAEEKMNFSDPEEGSVLREQLENLYYRCSFEKRELDKFNKKYGSSIYTGKS